jgi:antitoxin (DNA-binding transcriptional repressor) of toxin-antitoxin stability system
MTIRQDADAANAEFEALVDLALAGEEVILTIRGRDAARLVAISPNTSDTDG